MKLTFVSHASMIITTTDAVIWTDPWLSGTVFNDSWTLLPEASFKNEWLNQINFIWISHEHPDHFHLPTLQSLPDDFKKRVTVLYQMNNSDKVIKAMQRLGYQKFVRLSHAKFFQLTSATSLWCYQVCQMDSALGVISQGKSLFNLNDAQLTGYDCKLIQKKFGPIDVILNQYSLAGYNGHADYENYLPTMASDILKYVYNIHVMLKAKYTIPFASMIYFSTQDNKYINLFANTPQSVVNYFKLHKREKEIITLYPGDTYTLDESFCSLSALKKYDHHFFTKNELNYSTPPTISFDELVTSFNQLHRKIKERYHPLFLWMLFLKPIKIFIPDINKFIIFDLIKGSFVESKDTDYDMEILSQPLHFAMKFDWGMQTLGVSGRHKVFHHYKNYRRHRLLFSLNNAEIWVKPTLLINKRNIQWILERINGLFHQIVSRLASQKE